jgi:DNA topoisomerase I
MSHVVIVESPAKAKTINKYLGKDYEVIASFGHVRDLPSKDGSVDPENDFAMIWEADGRGAKQLAEIAKLTKVADSVILATDPDREGEAISWHVLDALRGKKAIKKSTPVSRVTFNAITQQAVMAAMAAPREIDQALVDAYLARRALDYLVGFNLSPVLWRKLPGAKSAGRVQSVSLRLVCQREAEIEAFIPREYWSILAKLKTPRNDIFDARLVGADGKKLARLDVGTESEAKAFKIALENAAFVVESVEAKPARRNPYAPFTTSTLQMEASRKLGLAPNITMRLAQKLYEGITLGGETVGLITYMRTDGVDMAPEAIAEVRTLISKDFGGKYCPSAPRKYTSKAKNAQEAHEAIRPTDVNRHPRDMAKYLESEELKLYELIWKRTVASQMESAVLERTTAEITAKPSSGSYKQIDLRATGQVVKFDGFLTLYTESKDDEDDEENARLPILNASESLAREAILADKHVTEPPARYSEATLVKKMEELGIGRPSTYAAVLQTLRDREYVTLEKKRLVPSNKGRIVTIFLENYFEKYVEYDFTADLEEKLDLVSSSDLAYKDVLRDFWSEFNAAVLATKELRISDVIDKLNIVMAKSLFPPREDGSDPRICPTCKAGQLSLKLGKYGSFVGCSSYPECKYTKQLGAEEGEDGAVEGNKALGLDPVSGLEVTLRDGRFGPFVQLGEEIKAVKVEKVKAVKGAPKEAKVKEEKPKDVKPKRASLPKGMSTSAVDLTIALKLLSMPLEIARHPETGEPIKVGIGKFGPYVMHGKVYASLQKDDDPLEIGANRAISLIIDKETGVSKGAFGKARAAPSGRVLGDHPEGGAISAHSGRFGPYVKWGKINATLPKAMTEDGVTLEQAVDVVRAKVLKGAK